jgi:energy-coupling factor transporter ATP-binding protein EcfA2
MKLKQIRVDGYKNLVDCEVNLGDFNVLVGPNNSGKSNLLEAIQMLMPICFGDDSFRKLIFRGLPPPPRSGSSVCHLKEHRCKPMSIAASFEIPIKKIPWIVDYEVTLQCSDSEEGGTGFVSELLTAKKPSIPGPARIYIRRKDKELEVCGKHHSITRDNPSLLAIQFLYPEFEGLPSELKIFISSIKKIGASEAFSISPRDLRSVLLTEKPMMGVQITSFDLPLVIDELKQKGEYYEFFIQNLCHILDFEDARVESHEMILPSEKKMSDKKSKLVRLFYIKHKNIGYDWIDEYSDGTFAAAAILGALLSGHREGPILCVEEPENYLHPSALEKLLRFLQDHSDKWPVLITTHSPYLLNGIRPEDVNVAVVDRTGAAHFEKIKNSRQLRDYLNKGLLSFGDLLVNDFEGFRKG